MSSFLVDWQATGSVFVCVFLGMIIEYYVVTELIVFSELYT